MKTNHKLILLGLTVDVLASLSSAGAANSSLKASSPGFAPPGFKMDPRLYKLAMEQESQSMALVSLAGKGMALYGLHMTHPKTAIALGVAFVGLGAVPAAIDMIDRTRRRPARAHAHAMPLPPPIMAPPPMVDDSSGGMYQDAMW